MATAFLVCAVVGSTLLIIQLVMTVLGFDEADESALAGGDAGGVSFEVDGADGGDVDAADGGDSSHIFNVLSYRSLVAAVAFFGVGGSAAQAGGFSPYSSLLVGLLSGAIAMVGVAWLFRMLMQMHSEGNQHIENAIGMPATVYLPIPAAKSGVGKVTLTVQDRTLECLALTRDEEQLATGASVVVTGIIDGHTVEVKRA